VKVRAREALSIIWQSDKIPGFIVYGLTALGTWKRPALPVDASPAGTCVHQFRLYGDNWEVMRWDVAPSEWPTGGALARSLRGALEYVLEGGCAVSWVGCEFCPFVDPPDLFLPEYMTGGVLAAMTSDGEFYCPLDPDEPLTPLADEVLEHLRRYAHGLADIS